MCRFPRHGQRKDGKNGFWFSTDSDFLAAAGAGDVNHDGFGDILFGDPGALTYDKGGIMAQTPQELKLPVAHMGRHVHRTLKQIRLCRASG
jgi:hypothetical protein